MSESSPSELDEDEDEEEEESDESEESEDDDVTDGERRSFFLLCMAMAREAVRRLGTEDLSSCEAATHRHAQDTCDSGLW